MAGPRRWTTSKKMRRLTIAVLAALVLPATALSGANPHAERLRLTPAGGKLATRALLRRTDLPDWTAIPTPATNSNLTCPGFDPDVSAYTVNGRAAVTFVHSALAEIGSTAYVFASHAHAVGDFKAGAKPQLVGCLR